MGRWFFIFLFLTGVVPIISYVPRKYFLIPNANSWTAAQNYCRSNYDDLATIESTADLTQIHTLAQQNMMTSNTWIGLYLDINSWRWSLQNESLGGFQKWCPKTPNNLNAHQECAAIDLCGWDDYTCTHLTYFICYDETGAGADRYIHYPVNKTWYAAQTYCRKNHNDLASSRNITEFSHILSKISGHTWIGLYRDAWKWSDQTVPSYMPWAPGMPDNLNGGENCACLAQSLYADDLRCSSLLPFFCHLEIRSKNIIRLKIQSDQNLDDPAVNSAILDQIYQKVKNHGIKNIIVKFRKQAAGNVFCKEQEHYATGNN